jgi:hypothetical protein
MRRAFKFSLWIVVLLAALSIVLLTATVYTYDRLTAETLIAELRFDEAGERQYVAYVKTGDRNTGSIGSKGVIGRSPSRTRCPMSRTI